jgi:hypothetical protein
MDCDDFTAREFHVGEEALVASDQPAFSEWRGKSHRFDVGGLVAISRFGLAVIPADAGI